MIITIEQLQRAQQKAQEIWDRYRCEETEDLIKKQIYVELINYDDQESEQQIEALNELWAATKDMAVNNYWGPDGMAVEFCKRLEMAIKLKHLNII